MTRRLPDLVLIHGGGHAADCWDPTVAELRCQRPELRVLAIDLPGRRGKRGDLCTASIAGWVDSVVADVEAAGLDDVVIVGHSMAGLTVPGVVAALGASRVREMVLVAAFLPPQGASIVESLTGPLALLARHGVRRRASGKVPTLAARYAFCNGMTAQQRAFTLSRLCADAASVARECVDRSALPPGVPRTWILTTRDRALSINSQTKSIEALGGVDTAVRIDACHDVMISHPQRLAEILLDRCLARQAL
ncbi:MAG: alpha/beta fold hydrolase [Mycobacterium sp.]